jgi:hypothetical protein
MLLMPDSAWAAHAVHPSILGRWCRELACIKNDKALQTSKVDDDAVASPVHISLTLLGGRGRASRCGAVTLQQWCSSKHERSVSGYERRCHT